MTTEKKEKEKINEYFYLEVLLERSREIATIVNIIEFVAAGAAAGAVCKISGLRSRN